MIGVFAHHDGIIHDNAQRYDQPEQRNHVDRQSAQIHQRNRRAHRNGNARRHPECGTRVQEQEQQRHDQPEAHQSVLDQQIESACDRGGAGADQLHAHTRRQARLQLGHNLFDRALDADGVALVGTVHPDRHGRIVAHEKPNLSVDPFGPDRRHIPQKQL